MLISPFFNEQLLCVQIQKAQKDTDNVNVSLHFLGSACVKAARKHVGEIDPSRARVLYKVKLSL